MTKRALERYSGKIEIQTAVAGLIEMAFDEDVPVIHRWSNGDFECCSQFDRFAEVHGWTLGKRTLRRIVRRLEEIFRLDREYYVWLLHDRPVGCDVPYPWVGLVQIERSR